LKRGVVHKDVDRTKLSNRMLDEVLAMILRSYITWKDDCLSTGFPDPLCSVFGILGLVEKRNRDIGTFASEGDGNSLSYP
jgi:hypothetical protein